MVSTAPSFNLAARPCSQLQMLMAGWGELGGSTWVSFALASWLHFTVVKHDISLGPWQPASMQPHPPRSRACLLGKYLGGIFCMRGSLVESSKDLLQPNAPSRRQDCSCWPWRRIPSRLCPCTSEKAAGSMVDGRHVHGGESDNSSYQQRQQLESNGCARHPP